MFLKIGKCSLKEPPVVSYTIKELVMQILSAIILSLEYIYNKFRANFCSFLNTKSNKDISLRTRNQWLNKLLLSSAEKFCHKCILKMNFHHFL